MSNDVSTKNLIINLLSKEEYNSIEPKQDELYFIEESDKTTFLSSVSEIQPLNPSIGDKYISLIDNLIYTFNGNSWVDETTPTTDVLYIARDTNHTYVWDGNELLQVGGAGGVENIDNITIEENDNKEIQTIGVIERNRGDAIYDWVGTRAEYNQLQSYNDNYIYYITDDNENTSTMSMNNVLNRLNRAYAWTNKSINGSDTLYTIDNNTRIQYDNVESMVCSKSKNLKTRITNGQLYHNNNLINDTLIWSDVVVCENGDTFAIGDNNLYKIESNTFINFGEKTGVYQEIIGYNTNEGLFSIENGSLFSISFDGSSHSLIDSTGNWSSLYGIRSSNKPCFGIRNNILCSIYNDNTFIQHTSLTNIDYVYCSNENECYVIMDGKLYYVNGSDIITIDSTEVWVKVVDGIGLTDEGKLFHFDNITSDNIILTQVGSTSDFSDISDKTSNGKYITIKDGNVISIAYNEASMIYDIEYAITTTGGISKLFYGNTISSDSGNFGWMSDGVTTTYETIYTVPSPDIGYNIYSNIDMNIVGDIKSLGNLYINDGNKTYNRDNKSDTVFNGVSEDSKKQLLTMFDLITAIKG